ncbi:MAG: hypothetical protein QNJ22_08450 [Desulfosarcinaceae bacterium]|nr:hypothetical protein [Desulfosarcinaceae bacterium]
MHTKRLIFISALFLLAGIKLEDSFLIFCAAHTFVLSICVMICKFEMLSDTKPR